MHNALRMLVDWVNGVRGGILVSTDGNGTVKRPLHIISVDDGSDVANIAPITKGLIDGSLLRPLAGAAGVDFILGPYSAALTEPAAKVANEYDKLFVATATATSIYANRSLAFGIGPIAATFMHTGIELLHARKVKSVAIIFEDAAATKDWCKGAADKAKQLNITVVDSIQISQTLNRTEVANAVARFRAASPDAVVGCTYYDSCAEFLKQANATKFYIPAALFTICVVDPRFATELAATAAYVLGTAPWSEYDTQPDELMGWSPAVFAQKYKERFQQMPTPHAVSYFASGQLLTTAIEGCGCLNPKAVAQQLKQIRSRTVYGDTNFDKNRQTIVRFVMVQHTKDLVPKAVNASNVIFPTPSWEKRDCDVSGRCNARGGCMDDGTCVLPICPAGQFLMETIGGGGQNVSCEDCPTGYVSAGGLATQCTACMPGACTGLAALVGQMGERVCSGFEDFCVCMPYGLQGSSRVSKGSPRALAAITLEMEMGSTRCVSNQLSIIVCSRSDATGSVNIVAALDDTQQPAGRPLLSLE
jgi:ABC-type branched-subunit amino acid transport system substrate-binding protein